MHLVGVRVEVPTNQPIVLLREAEGERYLPIFIGSPEATAIVHAMQGMQTPRPMTHDLLKHVLDLYRSELRRIDITELHDGTFHAELVLDAAGAELRVDSRPSDAIALAVRFGIDNVEIWADDGVLAEAGVELPNAEEGDEAPGTEAELEQFRHFLEHITPEDFA
jgi:bifunctional DNase/RNase